MQYNFAVDPITKQQIVVFSCTGWYFPKNGFFLAKRHDCYWHYYQGNNIWLYNGWKTAFVFNTQEEAELACNLYLDFLKECGYAV